MFAHARVGEFKARAASRLVKWRAVSLIAVLSPLCL